ncbi:MAG: serine hydrolase [Planctomycetota bacterium]
MRAWLFPTWLLLVNTVSAQEVSPEAAGLDELALERLIEASDENGTDALVVLRDGRIVCERYAERGEDALHLMSVTKLFAWFAIGKLIDERKIASIDVPLATWFEEWGEDERRSVTLRHVLRHTSGIEHAARADVLNAQHDRVAFARGSRLRDEPGARVQYNNCAIALLSGIVRIASGQSMDEYLDARLFRPLDCTGIWQRDVAGQPVAYAELRLPARDLAKLGLLIARGGAWEGRQLISRDWIEQSTSAGVIPSLGLIWWRRVDERGAPIGGGVFHTGWLGQYLAVYPDWDLVVVRLTRGRWNEETGELDEARTSFPDFFELVEATVEDRALRGGADANPFLEEVGADGPGGDALDIRAMVSIWNVVIDRGKFIPPVVRGRLVLEEEDDELAGRFSLYGLTNWIGVEIEDVEVGSVLRFRGRNTEHDIFLEAELSMEGERWVGGCRMGFGNCYEIGRQPLPWRWSAEPVPDVRRLEPASLEAADTGPALREWVADLSLGAETSGTDALILEHNGRTVCHRFSERGREPIPLRDLTAVFSALAVSFLIEDGELEGFDVPLSRWWPEWRDDPARSRITIRDVFERSTGLEIDSDGSEDPVALTRAARVSGARSVRSGDVTPVCAIAEVVERVSGRPLDAFLEQRLFAPLEIEAWSWSRDEAGRPRAHDGLSLRPEDLARVMHLLLDEGRWHGQRLLSANRIHELLDASGQKGLLGLTTEVGEHRAVICRGALGQAVVLCASARLLAIRLTRGAMDEDDLDRWQVSFAAFESLLKVLPMR